MNVVGPQSSACEAFLKKLEWTVLRRLDGSLHGDWRSLWRGVGLDLADLREYQSLDDVRHIDWNVTARTGIPHVRLFNEDRDLTAWFLVDCSASQYFGRQGRAKSEVAAEFVGLMSRLLTRQGNRVGAIFYSTQVDHVLTPRTGRSQVLQLLRMMQQMPLARPSPRDDSVDTRGTNMGAFLNTACSYIKRRSIVFVVSDFISESGWEAPLGRLCLRHDVSAVRLFDPMEVSLPNLGVVWLQDAESGEQLLVDTSDAGFCQRFEEVARQREQELRAVLARVGVDTLELNTDEPLVDAILRLVDLRRRRASALTDRPVGSSVTKENPAP